MEEPAMPGIDLYRGFPNIALWIAGACLALCAACATRNNEALIAARQAYAEARQDTGVAQNAPVALSEAGQALRQAEQADDQKKTEHLAYIARQKVEIARETAATQMAQNEMRQLLNERETLLLQTRTQQVRRLQQELSALQAEQTERGLRVTLGDVLFGSGRAELKPSVEKRLLQLVSFLREHPDRNLLVEGYADSRGAEAYNLDLSERRAESVREFLTRSGIDPGRVAVRGYGERYPVASNGTSRGRLQNRRVEIYFSEPGQPVAERGR
jgi:outer membrane protein OmpA-like peptidoglycan-associated protein